MSAKVIVRRYVALAFGIHLLFANFISTFGILSYPASPVTFAGLPSEFQVPHDGLSSRNFFMSFRRQIGVPFPFAGIVAKRNRQREQIIRADIKKQCDEKSGVIVSGECYQYFDERKEFDEAREDCASRGGDLWTPDFDDMLLFNEIMTLMPEVASAGGESLWIGVMESGGVLRSVDGSDVTKARLLNILSVSITNNKCLLFKFSKGAFSTRGRKCSKKQEYICEYPFNPKVTEPQTWLVDLRNSL